MTESVPFFELDSQLAPLRAEISQALERCLDHKGFCLGPEVERFEADFARYHGARFGVGVNSGTSALHLAARILELGPGDEVITTPFTFVATSWAIRYVGATPVFVDVEPETLNLDPALLGAALTPRTRAVFSVHLYGHPCALDPISAFCSEHGLAHVEDAAQAHGALYHERPVGTSSRMSTWSFYPSKNLGAYGEGGALLTDDADVAARANSLRNHGSTTRYEHDELGYNYRMEGFQAAILGVKLAHLDRWVEQRRGVAERYAECLKDTPLRLPTELEGCRSSYHLYVVRHPRRDALKEFLDRAGIGCALHYPTPLHRLKAFEAMGHGEGSFPVAERAARECLSLPMYPELGSDQIERVSDAVHRFFADGG